MVKPPPGPVASKRWWYKKGGKFPNPPGRRSSLLRRPFPVLRPKQGSGKSVHVLFNMILKNFCLFDVVFTLRARRGRSRPLAVFYLYAPLSRSNTGRGEEELMNFVGIAHLLARQVVHNNRRRLSTMTTSKGKGGAR